MTFLAITESTDILPYTSVSSETTLNDSHYIVGCNASSGSVTITLPTSSTSPNGKIYYIKDEAGGLSKDPNYYTITIQAPTGSNLDGTNGDSISIETDYGSIGLYNDTTWGWLIIYNYIPEGGGEP